MKKKILAIASSILLAVSLSACGNDKQPQNENTESKEVSNVTPEVGGTLTVGISGEPYNLASWVSNDMNSHLIMNLVCPSLVSIDKDAKKQPYIMESYTASDDLKEYTVKIHDGISWHDGTPLTSEDMAFTAKYCVDKSLSFGADMFKNVERTEIVDNTTIKYYLKEPAVNFLTQMGYWVDIMPKHIYENVDDPLTFDYNGLGYGPYKMADYKKGEYYTLERVSDWPLANEGKGAYIEKIVFRVYPDPNSLVLAMKNGEVDVSGTTLPVSAQKQLTADAENFTVKDVSSLGFGYFAFNYNNEFLKDPIVRKAIAMTIDRDGLVTAALQGGAVKMESPISPVFTDLNKSGIKFPEFDVEGAKKLLEENGYTDTNNDGILEKNGTPMEMTLSYKNITPNIDAIANIFKANAEKAGIKINLQSLDIAAFTSNVINNHKYDINVQEWAVIDDADTGLGTIYLSDSALNFMEYKNEKIDEILRNVIKEPDESKRIQMMDEFQKEFVNELPVVNAWVKTNSYGCSNKFAGWDLSPGLFGVMDVKDLVNVYQVSK